MTPKNDTLARIIVGVTIACATMAALIICSSCNVTRTTTTESICVHRGDSSTTITTKTIETYDASRK